MRTVNASFELRLLGPTPADRADVDKALAIFIKNTSALLRTKSNQIRQKIANPITPEGTFYFAALCRSKTIIGFAMFGYYPRSKLSSSICRLLHACQRSVLSQTSPISLYFFRIRAK